jgi:acetyl-CoA carboxylase carboxyl transferase subunit beta
MAWFSRKSVGIQTEAKSRSEAPDGYWRNCPHCGEIISQRQLKNDLHVCPKCSYHFNLDSLGYFEVLFDNGEFETFDENLTSVDVLAFTDRIPYSQRIVQTQKKTGLNDAARSAMGKIGGHTTSIGCMDFGFIGGSMGSVVGEILTRSIRRGIEHKCPVIIISKSGGARMQEGALSLMQLAKTSANLAVLGEHKLPYISIMTDPTTGGVSASYAMLGDLNIAEPNALIGFAGPRVIRETIGQDLPEGFQRAEFLLEKGFLDEVVDRRKMRDYLINIFNLLLESPTNEDRTIGKKKGKA